MSRIHMPRRGLGIALIGGTSLALVLLQTAAFAATLGDAYVGTSGSAHGTTVGVQVAGQDVAQVGSTKASSGDDGSKSDATVLSVGGQEIAGAHASSGQGQGSDSSSTGYLQETCDQSGGQACVSVLFGRATTSDDGSSSTGSGDRQGLSRRHPKAPLRQVRRPGRGPSPREPQPQPGRPDERTRQRK